MPAPSVMQQYVDRLLAFHRSQFGDAVMTAPSGDTIPVTFDPSTGEPIQMPSATPPGGVWGAGVQPPAAPAPGATQVVPAPTLTPLPNGGFAAPDGTRFFTADDLEKARREEKDKVYGRVESIESELRTMREQRDAEIAQAQEEAAAAAAEAERQRLEGLSTEDRIVEMQQTWERRWAERDARDEQQNALAEQERRFQALTTYKQRRLAEEADLIHPTLQDLLIGNTEQEVEESITALKAKTDAIVADMQGLQVAQRQQARGVAPTGAPPVGPMDSSSGHTQTLTADDIRSMDPATYAKNREALMRAANEKWRSGNLYS